MPIRKNKVDDAGQKPKRRMVNLIKPSRRGEKVVMSMCNSFGNSIINTQKKIKTLLINFGVLHMNISPEIFGISELSKCRFVSHIKSF